MNIHHHIHNKIAELLKCTSQRLTFRSSHSVLGMADGGAPNEILKIFNVKFKCINLILYYNFDPREKWVVRFQSEQKS